MTTYRERREARAEQLREWADKRNAQAAAQLNSQPELRHDWAFITQPGRVPERERMNRRDDAAFRSMEKAASMTSRADEIERQADRSIYSDDPDAIERLREKLEGLEAERARWTAYNKAARKSRALVWVEVDGQRIFSAANIDAGALALLDAKQRAEVATLARVVPYQLGKHGEIASYVGANLSGNIKRTRDRIAQLEREIKSATDPDARPAGRYMVSRYDGTCTACGEAFPAGTPIVYSRATRSARHYPNCTEINGTEAA